MMSMMSVTNDYEIGTHEAADVEVIDLADDVVDHDGAGGDDDDSDGDEGWDNPGDVVCHRKLTIIEEDRGCVGEKCALFDDDERRCLDVLESERTIYYMDSIIEALNKGGADAVSAILQDMARRKQR